MYKLSFEYKGKEIKFESRKAKILYGQVLNWLYENGYKFSGNIHNIFLRKPHTLDEVRTAEIERSYKIDDFIKIKDSDIYFYRCGNISKIYPNIILMLENFGIDISKVKSENLGGGDIGKFKAKLVSDMDVDTDVDDDIDDVDIIPFSAKFGIPTDFKAAQSQDEKENKEYKVNPFRQAICVLGRSGAGKSYTIDDILDNSDHEYEFIIPSASTTGLLSQFSPSAKEGRGGYIPSRLGKMIENAYRNNNKLYTAVFDECHKSNIIEMINDELLQAISTERNKNRFISLDDETSDLYPSKILDRRGNIQITDNLGFIFISSNARVISGNEDFFNRVDLVEITKESRDSVKTIDDLNRLRVKDTDKKYELVSKIMSEAKR